MSNSVKFRVYTIRIICFMYPVSNGDVGAQPKIKVLGHQTGCYSPVLESRLQPLILKKDFCPFEKNTMLQISYTPIKIFLKKAFSWAKCIKFQHFIQFIWRPSEMKPVCFLHVTLARSEQPCVVCHPPSGKQSTRWRRACSNTYIFPAF